MASSLSRGQSVVYFLRLKSKVIYVGSSIDLEQRLEDHLAGQACRTTHFDPPERLLRIERHDSFSAARQREAQIKRWSRAQKEALVRGDSTLLRQLSQSRA
jgi:putative endonuclease